MLGFIRHLASQSFPKESAERDPPPYRARAARFRRIVCTERNRLLIALLDCPGNFLGDADMLASPLRPLHPSRFRSPSRRSSDVAEFLARPRPLRYLVEV